MRLGIDGLPVVEWVPLDTCGDLVIWGLWCRRCGATKRMDVVPDGDTAKTLLIDAFGAKHASCSVAT